MKHILAIHAHPDDIEIFAAGTLALLRQRGHRVTIVTMTPGDKGSDELGPEEIAAIRRLEAATAAAMIGAAYRCAEFRDLEVFSDDPSRRRIVELLRELNPDLILTSAPIDYMPDHEATSALVRDACFAAPCPNYRTAAVAPAPTLAAIPHLYYCDPVAGVDRDLKPVAPDFIVDVSAVFGTKRDMLAAHHSQREWLRRQHHMDNYLETMETWCRQRGQQAGVEFGEGFRHYRGHPYPEPPLLEELLGPDLVYPV